MTCLLMVDRLILLLLPWLQVLRKIKYAEQNQIAELAMIPMKEARIHLYKMYRDKYITYQEVPRRDHQPEVGNVHVMFIHQSSPLPSERASKQAIEGLVL